MKLEISKGQAAFITVTALAIATGGTAILAATTASKAAAVAYGILAGISGGASIASITAWMDQSAESASEYFTTMANHAGIAIAGMAQFAGQVMLQSLIQGAAQGIGTSVRRAIAGPDVTIREERQS